jgi:hypothetical protein
MMMTNKTLMRKAENSIPVKTIMMKRVANMAVKMMSRNQVHLEPPNLN